MAADTPSHQAESAPEALEPPGVALKPVLLSAAALVILLAGGLLLLGLYFRAAVPALSNPRARVFPSPRLETSIDPRMIAAVGPGPAPPKPPRVAPAPSPVSIEAAMQAITAKGARGYDPITPAAAGSATR